MAILKLLHVLFVFVWVGTLLTLTRLLGYLVKEPQPVQERMIKIIRRVYLFVDLPSMILTVIFGIVLLIFKDINWKAPWLHMKLTLAFLLIVCDVVTGRLIAQHVKMVMKEGIKVGPRYQIVHGIAGIIFIGILIAIYVFKAACTC